MIYTFLIMGRVVEYVTGDDLPCASPTARASVGNESGRVTPTPPKKVYEAGKHCHDDLGRRNWWDKKARAR
jgi:hypothetical protein